MVNRSPYRTRRGYYVRQPCAAHGELAALGQRGGGGREWSPRSSGSLGRQDATGAVVVKSQLSACSTRGYAAWSPSGYARSAAVGNLYDSAFRGRKRNRSVVASPPQARYIGEPDCCLSWRRSSSACDH